MISTLLSAGRLLDKLQKIEQKLDDIQKDLLIIKAQMPQYREQTISRFSLGDK